MRFWTAVHSLIKCLRPAVRITMADWMRFDNDCFLEDWIRIIRIRCVKIYTMASAGRIYGWKGFQRVYNEFRRVQKENRKVPGFSRRSNAPLTEEYALKVN